MKQLLILMIFILISGTWAAADDTGGITYSVGMGAGYESGIGLHLGLEKTVHKVHTNLGLLYRGDNAEFMYSVGVRYIRMLALGLFNNTYAWT
ncbi:MAG: hypothetical protein ABIA63_07755, partial [bacterium]